jgi:hypothetical protein
MLPGDFTVSEGHGHPLVNIKQSCITMLQLVGYSIQSKVA